MSFEREWKRFKKVFILQINCVGLVLSERLKCGILHVNTDFLLNVSGKYEKSRVFVFSHLPFLLCFRRIFVINYLLAKNYNKK